MSKRDGQVLRVGNRRVELSDLDKSLYPSGFTKAQIIDYYVRIAPLLLPHLRGRGVTLKTYPRGTDERVFFEKQCPSPRPPWLKTQSVPRQLTEGGIDYCMINDVASLIWVINLAAIELHVPLAHTRDWNRPREMVFDLDPGPPATLLDCCRLGVRFREVLARIGLQSFAKTSGGKGLHVYVPLNTPGVTFDDTKSFARAVAGIFEKQEPKHVVSVMTKSLRRGKVFVDWSQNDRTKTTVCVYSLRAKATPTVSTPVTWDEIAAAARRGDTSKLTFEAGDVLSRVKKLGDLFAPVLTSNRSSPRGNIRKRMIIDSHQHVFWHYRNDADLIADMDAHGIDVAWLLTWEISPAEWEANWTRVLNPVHRNDDGTMRGVPLSDLLLAHSRYPGRLILGYCPHPAIGDAPALFESAYHIHRVRVCGEWKFRMPFDDQRCIALFRKAGALQCPVVLHLDVQTIAGVAQTSWFGGDIGNIERALQLCPDTTFIGHAPGFWRYISGDADTNPDAYASGKVTPGGHVPRMLERYPNLYADLSAGSGLRALRRDPAHAKDFVTKFADRLLFARDYYGGELLEFLKSLELPTDVAEKIFFRNAEKLVPEVKRNPPPLRKL